MTLDEQINEAKKMGSLEAMVSILKREVKQLLDETDSENESLERRLVRSSARSSLEFVENKCKELNID